MQRLYSEFPAGHPGLGLMILRFVALGMILKNERFYAAAAENPGPYDIPLGLATLICGGMILAGLWTRLCCLVLLSVCLLRQLTPHYLASGVDQEPGYLIVLAGLALALLFTGPGWFSVDAYVFGPKRFQGSVDRKTI